MSVRKLIKKAIPTAVFDRLEPYAHLGENVIISVRHGIPAKRMRCIGVTGTNGKTTTTNMIFTMLREAGYNVALLSSTTYGFRDDLRQQVNHMTTDPTPVMQKKLRGFAEAGAEWVVVEASSHALAQYRVWGLPFEIAVMTNVTHEHLDYHKTFERYREAKRERFLSGDELKALGAALARAADKATEPAPCVLALRLLAVCLARFAACLVLAMVGIPGSGLKSEA